MPPPAIRARNPAVREELTERLWTATQAVGLGYRWIDRRDGVELFLLGLVYYDAAGGFLPTKTALELLEPWYEDMAR